MDIGCECFVLLYFFSMFCGLILAFLGSAAATSSSGVPPSDLPLEVVLAAPAARVFRPYLFSTRRGRLFVIFCVLFLFDIWFILILVLFIVCGLPYVPPSRAAANRKRRRCVDRHRRCVK